MWERIKDPASGRHYFYNDETQVTQWEFPEDVLVQQLNENGWDKAVTSTDGVETVYFFNQETSESSWDIPEAVIAKLKELFGDDLTQEEIKGEEVKEAVETEVAGEIEEEKEEPVEEVPQNVPLVNQLIDLDQLAEPKDENMVVEGKPEDLFMEMLKEGEFTATSIFKDVITKSINDPRYWNVTGPIERSKLFDIYIIQKTEEEYQHLKEKYRDEYFDLLEKNNVKYYTRWTTYLKSENAHPESDEISKLSERIKFDIFKEYISMLRKEKEEASNKVKTQELESLEKEILEKVQISTEFTKVLEEYTQNYKHLTKGDILTVFEKVISIREEEHIGIANAEKKKNYTTARKARSDFLALVKNMISSKELVLSSQLKWYQFLNALKDKKEFKELCGQSGSTVIDYYWDMIDGVYVDLNNKKETVKQILTNKNKKVTELDEPSFVKLMKTSGKKEIDSLCDDDLKTLYGLFINLNESTKRPASDIEDSTEKRQKILLRKNI